MALELKFVIKYKGGKADSSLLDLYDAAASMHGLAKALAITSHALVTNGQIRRQADNIPNVNFYLHPSKKGSFIELITIIFEEPAVQAIGASVLATAFWDFINFTWSQATGREYKLTEYQTKKIVKENDSFQQDIISALEIPLIQIHRPILHDDNIEIEINRPRVGTILNFNKDTLDFVNSKNTSKVRLGVIGNVTKYNILSGIGRLYVDDLKRTIPFHCANNLTEAEKNILTWSLDRSNRSNNGGKIIINVDEIRNGRGLIKSYLIKNAERHTSVRQVMD
jgi:hypothetical protein